MASINFKYGLEDSLQSESLSEGVMYLTLDTKYIYADLQVNGVLTRVKISDLTSLQSNFNALSNSLNDLSDQIEGKVDKVTGKGLSTNDFTTAHKTKLESLQTAASNGYNGTIYTSGDGVAEMGKYIDFHNTSTGTNDYDTRLVCTGETQNQINLPTNNGTLIIGDKEYKIVVSSSKPASGTASNVITIVTGG